MNTETTTAVATMARLTEAAAVGPIPCTDAQLRIALTKALSVITLFGPAGPSLSAADVLAETLMAILRVSWNVGMDEVLAAAIKQVAGIAAQRAHTEVEFETDEPFDNWEEYGLSDEFEAARKAARRPFAVEALAETSNRLASAEAHLQAARSELATIQRETSAEKELLADAKRERARASAEYEAIRTALMVLDGKAQWFAVRVYTYHGFWVVKSFEEVALCKDDEAGGSVKGVIRMLRIVSECRSEAKRGSYNRSTRLIAEPYAEFAPYSDGSGGSLYQVMAFESKETADRMCLALNNDALARAHDRLQAAAYASEVGVQIDLSPELKTEVMSRRVNSLKIQLSKIVSERDRQDAAANDIGKKLQALLEAAPEGSVDEKTAEAIQAMTAQLAEVKS